MTPKRKTKKSKRTFTVLVVEANHPDEIDGQGFEERRRNGLCWDEIELLHPGAPDGLLRGALELDQGVYRSAHEWDRATQSVVETSLICADDVGDAAEMLKPFVSKPTTFAKRLIEHAKSGEDPARVAGALKKEVTSPAGGPAEEAATYVRLFREHVPTALKFRMGIAWELRNPASCECAVYEGTSPGNPRFPPWLFRTLETHKSGGRVACKTCRARFTYESDRLSTRTRRTTRETANPPR